MTRQGRGMMPPPEFMATQAVAGSVVAYAVARRAVRKPGVSPAVAARHGADCGAWALAYVFGPGFWTILLMPVIAGTRAAMWWWLVEAAVAAWLGRRLVSFIRISPVWEARYLIPTWALSLAWVGWMFFGTLLIIRAFFSA